MDKLKLLSSIIFCIFLNSCTIQGLTNDYGKLTNGQKSLILPLKSFENLENGKIYSLNSTQLKEELQKHPKSIVYVFTNGCKTKHCLPTNIYKSYAEANNYKLFLVMNGYANLDETLDQMAELPYYSIDNEFYGVSNRNKYTTYFENELMNLPKDYKHKEYLGNLFFFEKGEFKNVYIELPKVN
ncbi:hypothetical protein [Moheibacter sediminis]|uniref:Uncharacterized protein n=1 Tax=Moheibacter sediminis TaxID=1434700 RepID=A0A1W2CUL5_9FLAO|nr:hypothetical protein [Moheibacter sediminis]SMC88592.1 hypothetical protein SAMN06296427_11158 [Moheibacter sediminis]